MSLLLLLGSVTGDPPPVVAVAQEAPDFHVFLAHNNLVDGSILTGGAYVATLPLANVKNRTLARVARSSDLLTTSTQFDMDLGVNKRWRVLALVNHNLGLGALYRVRSGSSPTFATTDMDSGWLAVWPAVYDTEDLDWDDPNYWEGTYTDSERQGYTWTLIHKLSGSLSARYVRVEIDDSLNELGYVQFGRVFIADGYVPSRNMVVGANLGWEDDSEIDRAYGGAEYFDERDRFRVARFTIANLDTDEGYRGAFEIMRQAGVTKEVLLQWNPADTKNAIRQSFVGRMRQLSPIEHPYPLAVSAAFEIQEARK